MTDDERCFFGADVVKHYSDLESMGYSKEEPVFWELVMRFVKTFTHGNTKEYVNWTAYVKNQAELRGFTIN